MASAAVIAALADNANVDMGPIPASFGTVTIGAGTYTTGGFAVTAANLGLPGTLQGLIIIGRPTGMIVTDGLFAVYNSTTGKIQLFSFAAATVAGGPLWEELPNATALTSAPYVIPVLAFTKR